MKRKSEAELRRELLADELRSEAFTWLRPSTGVDANWHITNRGDTCVAHCFGFAHDVAQGEALALRIAAALNYCRGIPTAHLLAHANSAASA